MSHANTCAHEPCSCPVPEGDKYCSNYCRESVKVAELTCSCGHRGCTKETHPKTENAMRL
jgi:hypothetical protein